MPYLLKYIGYDMYIGKVERDCYHANASEDNAQRFRTRKSAIKFMSTHKKGELEVVYEKPVPKNRPFTYKVLMEQAEKMYNRIVGDSPFCAHFETRDFIASKIDECVDVERNKEAKKVREWDEYKKYAPMKKADYEARKKDIKEWYKKSLADLEKDWNTRGKNNPNFHKV